MAMPHTVDFCNYKLRFHKSLLMSVDLKQSAKHTPALEVHSVQDPEPGMAPSHGL